MKIRHFVLGLALGYSGIVCAQQAAPLPTAEALPRAKTDAVHVPAKDARVLPMAEWEVVQSGAGEQSGARVLIAEGREAVDKAPAQASRYEARAYKFPTGAIRILHWKKGPVVHAITFETELFVIEGTVDVEVGGRTVTVAAGDAVFMPSGVMRNPKPNGDTVIAQFFVTSTGKDAKAAVVRGKDLEAAWTVQWMEGDKPMTARTKEEIAKAPASAARYSAKRYVFDGNSVRYAELKKGGRTHTGKTQRADALIYVTKGKLRRTEGDVVFEASAGDALRELVGVAGHWDLLEDSAFIATDAPFDNSAYRANP